MEGKWVAVKSEDVGDTVGGSEAVRSTQLLVDPEHC